MGLGTDLIGETQHKQNRELAIRHEVEPAADILHSMWVVNPALCHLEGRIGVVAPDAYGDLVISRVNPLEDLLGFANPETAFSQVIQAGQPMLAH